MQPEMTFAAADQKRALALSTIAFTVNFAVWTIFSIIGVEIKKDLALSEFEFGLLVATPILTGSVAASFLASGLKEWVGALCSHCRCLLHRFQHFC